MSNLNYLGTFNSIAEAWEKYPYGGKEGDYIIINGIQLDWDKYKNDWGRIKSTPARKAVFLGGDLFVAGNIRAHKLKGMDQGLWSTPEALKKAVPSPEIGNWAAVGSGFPAALWVCNTKGIWEYSGTTYDGGGVNLEEYDTSLIVDDKIQEAINPILDKLELLTPLKLENEEAHDALVDSGDIVEGQIYYTTEE